MALPHELSTDEQLHISRSSSPL
ncbi:hypothetical protein [Bradyrhizobium sp. CCBAU 21359]